MESVAPEQHEETPVVALDQLCERDPDLNTGSSRSSSSIRGKPAGGQLDDHLAVRPLPNIVEPDSGRSIDLVQTAGSTCRTFVPACFYLSVAACPLWLAHPAAPPFPFPLRTVPRAARIGTDYGVDYSREDVHCKAAHADGHRPGSVASSTASESHAHTRFQQVREAEVLYQPSTSHRLP